MTVDQNNGWINRKKEGKMSRVHYAAGGIGLGSVIAVLLTWTVHHSIIWAIIGAALGWLYVGFYVCRYYLYLF